LNLEWSGDKKRQANVLTGGVLRFGNEDSL